MNTLSVKMNDFITYIGANDRLTPLFENQWPLPKGVAYNSYLLTDEKTALMDGVHVMESELLIEKLEEALGGRDLDYFVVHHVEPDHSGAISLIRRLYPNVRFVGNKKTFEFLENFFGLVIEDPIVVKEGDELNLGKHSLKFFMTPMVHWPESMVSYDAVSGTLFSQDIFGGFGSLDGMLFDDEVRDLEEVGNEAVRYYVNIVGKYSKMAQGALKKLGGLDIRMICPVHGPIWRAHPEKILQLYQDMTAWKSQNGVVIAYGTMYGNTERMVDFLARELAADGIQDIRIYNVSKTDLSVISSEIWKYRGILLGSPTYNNALFPPMMSLLNILDENKMQNKTVGIFGNYSWSGGGVKELNAWAETQKFERVEPIVEARSGIKKADYERLRELAGAMADNLRTHEQEDQFPFYSLEKGRK